MNLKILSDADLLSGAVKAAETEREATTALLHYLNEVQRRRLYAKKGRDSLFEFCVKDLKMSEGHAARRVNAAQALADFPEIGESIQSGALSLTSVSQAQSFFKREARAKRIIPRGERQYILEKLENKSTRTAEKILLSHSSAEEPPVRERVQSVSPTQTRVSTALDEQTIADLDRLKEIWSHEMPGASYADVIRKMATLCRKQFDPLFKAERALARKERIAKRKAEKAARKATAETRAGTEDCGCDSALESCERSACVLPETTTAPGPTPTAGASAAPAPELALRSGVKSAPKFTRFQLRKRTRYIDASTRYAVWVRDGGRCTYVDPVSGERCCSRRFVQLDHIVPFARGGGHKVSNLRLRCFEHNRLHAVESYGEEIAESRRMGAGS